MRHLVPLLVFSLAQAAGADDVHLVGGGKVTGEIVERTAQKLVIETGPGMVTVPLSRVERIVASPSALADFRERARALGAGDVAGWLSLGRWADARGLATQASLAYRKALEADPANAEANHALGRALVGGRWLTPEESYREQGLVPFDGSWVTPAEREAAQAERVASDLAERNAREADARVREAEARARGAEAEARRAETEAAAQESEGDGIPYWPYVYPGGGVVLPPDPPCCLPEPEPRPVPPPRAPAPRPRSIHASDADSDDDPAPQTPPAKAVPRGKRAR
jgi:hypothetical protein